MKLFGIWIDFFGYSGHDETLCTVGDEVEKTVVVLEHAVTGRHVIAREIVYVVARRWSAALEQGQILLWDLEHPPKKLVAPDTWKKHKWLE